MSRKYTKPYEEYIKLFKELCNKLIDIPNKEDLKNNNLPSESWFVKNCPESTVKNYKDVVKWIHSQSIPVNTPIKDKNLISKNWKPTKTYHEYIVMFKSACEELGRSITPFELEKHKFDLPSAIWLVKYSIPDIKTYDDFLKYLGYEAIKKRNPTRKYTYEIAYEEFAKRGYILLPQEYISCAKKLKYICPKHPNTIHEISLNALIFGNKGCWDCYTENYVGSVTHRWKGGIAPLNTYLREFINIWKKDSMVNCNYKCVITGGKFNVIHHLYSYNKILKETLDESKLPIHQEIKYYTKEELEYLKDILIRKHYEYPLGICLCKVIHGLYHNLYGDDNTPEQFEEFKTRYNSGEFKDIIIEDNILEKIDIFKLSKGLIVKSYLGMCKLISAKVKYGSEKIRLQLLEWEKYFKYHREGRKFIIDEILKE